MFIVSSDGRKVTDALELYLLTFKVKPGAFNRFKRVSLTLTRSASQPVIPPVPPVSLTTPGVQAVFRGPPCIVGSVFLSARLTTTWTPTADVEVGPVFEVKGQRSGGSALPSSPLPACHSSCTSCWGPSVSQCTSCSGGLLLHQGQCVETCGEGLYSQDHTCHSKKPSMSDFPHIFTKRCSESALLTVALLAPRLPPVLSVLRGAAGLRLPPVSQTGGSAAAPVWTAAARRVHGRVSCTQTPG